MNFTLKMCTDLDGLMPCLQSLSLLFKRLVFREGKMSGFVLQHFLYETLHSKLVNNVYKPNCTY